QQVVQMWPEYVESHFNLAVAYLPLGRFEQGWREHEWRWQSRQMTLRHFPQPRWDGAPLDGRTILLYAEQGLGDCLQFIRYATLVQRRGGRVLVECPAVLMPLLARCPGVDRLVASQTTLVVGSGADVPAFD